MPIKKNISLDSIEPRAFYVLRWNNSENMELKK